MGNENRRIKMKVVYQKNVGNLKYYNIFIDNVEVGSVVIFREARKEDGQTFEYIERLSVDTNLADYDQVKEFIESYVMEND